MKGTTIKVLRGRVDELFHEVHRKHCRDRDIFQTNQNNARRMVAADLEAIVNKNPGRYGKIAYRDGGLVAVKSDAFTALVTKLEKQRGYTRTEIKKPNSGYLTCYSLNIRAYVDGYMVEKLQPLLRSIDDAFVKDDGDSILKLIEEFSV